MGHPDDELVDAVRQALVKHRPISDEIEKINRSLLWSV